MPRPNRVTPFGAIEADPARGTLFGNRGCLVDARSRLVREWRLERWIACVLDFKGRRRAPLMAPGRYTELFFLDEATALAAGHRPCAECRRAEADAFRAAWRELHPDDPAGLPALDRRLHAERLAGPWTGEAADLPDGAMVALGAAAWLVLGGEVLAWTHAGYTTRRRRPSGPVPVLTPPSTVGVLRARPLAALHPSATVRPGKPLSSRR